MATGCVAVQAPIAAPKGMFRGDHDCLVDALIVACQKKTVAISDDLSTFRVLRPYFDDENPMPTLPDSSKRAAAASKAPKRKGSPPERKQSPSTRTTSPSTPAGSIVRAATMDIPRSGRKDRHSFSGVSAEAMSMSPPTAAAAGPRPTSGKPRAQGNSKMTYFATPIRATSCSGFACPGMFSSPKPETLPVPMSLLSRMTTAVPLQTAVAV